MKASMGGRSHEGKGSGNISRVRRSDWITSSHVGGSFEVHNGRAWVLIRPTQDHVNLRFGGYVKTRTTPVRTGSAGKKK